MKTKGKILLIILILLSGSGNALAQSSPKVRADSLYNHLAYNEAIGKYKFIVAHDSSDNESLVRLADCYRLTNDVHNAVRTYRIIVAKGIAEPIHLFYYAIALLETGDKKAATEVMSQYTADERGAVFTTALTQFERFFDDSTCYRIAPVSFNSRQQDFAPIIFNGKIIFASSRDRTQWVNYSHTWTGGVFYRLYQTKKNDNGKFSSPKKFAPYTKNKYNNGPTAFDTKGLVMMLTRNNIHKGKEVKASDGKVKLTLVQFSINEKNGRWEELGEFAYNNPEYNFAHAAFSADNKVMYFSSDMPGTIGGMDLWYCKVGMSGLGEPINAGPDINTKGNEVFPSMINGNLYYSSDGLAGMGGLDLFEVRTEGSGIPSSMPVNMGYPVNSSGDDFGICYAASGKKAYFSSNRKDINQNDDIYELTIVNEPLRGIRVLGICQDNFTKEILPGTKVYLKNAKGDTLGRTITDEKGAYSFTIDYNKNYIVAATKEAYIDGVSNIPARTYRQGHEFEVMTGLDKDPKTILLITLKDAKTGAILNYAKALVIGQNNDTTFYSPDNAGIIRFPATNARYGMPLEIPVVYKSKNYFDKAVIIQNMVEAEGEIAITELLNMPDIGMDVGKMVNINPIYYDLNSAEIREDASVELDKIVEIMKQYPNMVIELGSYTDCRGAANYNLSLSDRRAKSSVKYIISKGISKRRIYGKGYGESNPVNHCRCDGQNAVPCTDEEFQMNRRTEFIIKKLK